jgi:hypothetical protein
MTAYVSRAWLTDVDRAQRLVDAWRGERGTVSSVVSAIEVVELHEETELAPDIDRTFDGVMFDRTHAIRWRHDAGRVWVRVDEPDGSESLLSTGPEPMGTLTCQAGEEHAVVLWGSLDEGTWTEGRIPRPLQYHLRDDTEDGAEIWLTVQELQPSDHSGVLVRYVGLATGDVPSFDHGGT